MIEAVVLVAAVLIVLGLYLLGGREKFVSRDEIPLLFFLVFITWVVIMVVIAGFHFYGG